jgi:hypothetical protein
VVVVVVACVVGACVVDGASSVLMRCDSTDWSGLVLAPPTTTATTITTAAVMTARITRLRIGTEAS